MRLSRIIFSLVLMLSTVFGYAQGVASFSTSTKNLPDGNIEVIFNVELESSWYIYSVNKVKGGPMPTTFTADASDAYTLVGALENVDVPSTKIDKGFGLEVEYYEEYASFRQIIRPVGSEAFKLTGYLEFQTCNGDECLLNEEEVSVNIKPVATVEAGKTDASAATEAPVKKAENADSSIISFLLIAFLAGLAGCITPCVFPMIPMTVGFLLGGSSTSRSGIAKGLIFGGSIIVIYSVLGLVVALFQSTAATDAIGTHWIPNLIFAALFLLFAMSFLGAFEITLPSGMANKADRQADKGGYLAAFFVALAMTIVSFSCTGPFVGSILAAAVIDGVALKPILGMAVFGLGFSLPFVILSFFPGFMKKLPKSGGWLNVVKVVFAFIMLAFAMKFLYNIDAFFGWGVITRLGFIAVWFTLVLLLGLYFLGVWRTSHDSPIEGAGWGRTVAAIVCLSFAFYLLPGLFGAPLKSISGLIPPQDGSTNVLGGVASEASSDASAGYASLESYSTLDEAIAESRATGKPVFVAFKSHTCSVCKMMESTVLSDEAVLKALSEDFVVANLYVDDKREDSEFRTLGRRFRDFEMKQFASASQPLYAVINADCQTLSGPVGNSTLEEFIEFLQIK